MSYSSPACRCSYDIDRWEALDPTEIDFSATGLVSAFIRHRLGDSPLAAATERNVVQIADPALPPKSRMSDRQQIRKNLRRGYRDRGLFPAPRRRRSSVPAS